MVKLALMTLGTTSGSGFSRTSRLRGLHVQLQLPINSVNAFVVPGIAPHVAQIQKHRPKPQLRW